MLLLLLLLNISKTDKIQLPHL